MSTVKDFSYREISNQDLDRDLREKGLFPDVLRKQQENVRDEQYHNHLTDGKGHLTDMISMQVHLIEGQNFIQLRKR